MAKSSRMSLVDQVATSSSSSSSSLDEEIDTSFTTDTVMVNPLVTSGDGTIQGTISNVGLNETSVLLNTRLNKNTSGEGTLERKARMELTTKQYHDWKQIFSGALNDRQLLCGIVLILCFYVFYSIFNIAITDKDKDDHEDCQCTLIHRRCFHTLIFGFCLIWIVCFATIIIYDLYRLYKKHQLSKSVDPFSKLDDKLKLYEKHLWLEFYKAYSVGSGTYENQNISSLDRTKEQNPLQCKYNALLGFYKKFYSEAGGDETDSAPASSTECNSWLIKFEKIKETLGIIIVQFLNKGEEKAQQSFYVLYPFLVIVRLLAQVILVPMLLLQMLNTNTWICITEGYNCQNVVTGSQLGLYQAYMTFGFYIALLVAILASTMLRWFPQSKTARDASAASFM